MKHFGKSHSFRALRLFCALGLLTAPLAAGAQTTYLIREISPFPQYPGATWAHGLNSQNQVVGHLEWIEARGLLPARPYASAFVWKDGYTETLPGFSGAHTVAYRINDAGQIAGSAEDSAGVVHACLWQNHTLLDLGGLAEGRNASVTSLSEDGVIVGTAQNEANDSAPVAWQNGQIKPLAEGLAVHARNAQGSLAGTGVIASPTGGLHAGIAINGAILLRAGLSDTPVLLAPGDSCANALNAHDTVVGVSRLTAVARAFVWKASTTTLLPFLSRKTDSAANALNNADVIVGTSDNRAVLWEQTGTGTAVRYQVHDLNNVRFSAAGWTLRDAVGITDSGVIVGNGLHFGRQRAFLLLPVTAYPGG